MKDTKELLKLAASCLEDLQAGYDELQEIVKKAELVEKIASKLRNQFLISDVGSYLEKVSELNTKTLEELDSLNTWIDVYAPQAQLQFGKLAELTNNETQSSSPEEAFGKILLS